MNKLSCLAACAVLALAARGAYAQCDDPFDKILCAYTLTESEELQFDNKDGEVSEFWNNWEGRDYIELVPPDDCYPERCGFTGPEDATITIRAAGTGRGVYLYFEVSDNTWVDRSSAEDIGADATDMFFDAMDANSIFTCTDCYIGLYNTTLTYTSQQFQVWMGATNPPTGFNFQHYDDNLWSWQATGMSWDVAEVLYGFLAEVIQIEAGVKVQEWFFPWEKFGEGIDVGTDLGGRMFGFTGGYNDKDGDNPNNHCLRWTTKDPWAGDAQEVNYWGDLLCADDMGTVEQVVSVEPNRSVTPAVPSSEKIVGTELFTLRGQKIARRDVRDLPTGTVVMQRHTLADGSQRTEILRDIR